ncbi:MAG: response regulator transcription factor [Reichenbachiella sp.]|uniref:response regulator transcription factor n=1 Tax=Reichenbachiella sp. TaxID=2184521 RepID=UPI0032637DC9
MTHQILIVEDHQVVKEGLKLILEAEEPLEVAGALHDGNEVMTFLEDHPVDLVLLDINLPNIDGITLTTQIKDRFPKIKVLILTFYKKAAFIQEVAQSGAEGYVLKNSPKEEVISAIYKVLDGGSYFSKEVTNVLLSSMRKQGTEHVTKLTKREIEVMILLATAYTVNEVAEKLFISAHTAETHRKNIMAKLRFKNKAELTLYAKENGYLDLPGRAF